MMIQESFVNATEGHRFGDSEPYEPFTDNVGKLFVSLRREYGRCTGRIYVDQPDGPTIAVGWTFEKRMQYEDCKDTYTREVWITLLESADTVTRKKHYKQLA